MQFSVVVPLYNKETSIKSSIESVLAQTSTDFELLVVNDGSTDDSREVVANIKDSRIRIVDKLNGGVSTTRNEGIQHARFTHIAFLDADDYWEPDFLKTIEELIRDYPMADCYTTGYVCKYDQLTLNVFGARERGIVVDFFKQVYTGPIMNSSTVCVKKSTFVQVGNFNQNIRRGEDYDMWARIARSASIAATPDVKVWYRLKAENRAMAMLHQPGALWLWYIPAESKNDKNETRYYRRFIHRQVIEYMVKGRLRWAWQIAAHNRKIAGWYTYFILPGSLQFRQVKSWTKLLRIRLANKKAH